jgi:hypothetical protein
MIITKQVLLRNFLHCKVEYDYLLLYNTKEGIIYTYKKANGFLKAVTAS